LSWVCRKEPKRVLIFLTNLTKEARGGRGRKINPQNGDKRFLCKGSRFPDRKTGALGFDSLLHNSSE